MGTENLQLCVEFDLQNKSRVQKADNKSEPVIIGPE